jgi:hypothetical protein
VADVGAEDEERGHDARVPTPGGLAERGVAVRLQPRPALVQPADGRFIAPPRRAHERRSAPRVAGVDVRAQGDKGAHDLGVAGRGRAGEGGAPVRAGVVEVRAEPVQRPHDLVAPAGRGAQKREGSLVPGEAERSV